MHDEDRSKIPGRRTDRSSSATRDDEGYENIERSFDDEGTLRSGSRLQVVCAVSKPTHVSQETMEGDGSKVH